LRLPAAALAIAAAAALHAADPLGFAWGTYLGGTSSDYANDTVTDPAGNMIVVGQTSSNGAFVGGWDTTYNGSIDGYVVKLSPQGEHLWSTYLGGAGQDWANAVAVNPQGEILVAGYTASNGWVSGGGDTTYGSNGDAFVAKLSAAGVLLWASYIGGSEKDDAFGVSVDGAGNVFVAGGTFSEGWTRDGGDTTWNGGADAFVARFAADGARLWSTYVGGLLDDVAYGVAADNAGNAYVVGGTLSSGWTAGGFDTTYHGATDGFLVKLNPGGTHAWSSYLGGTDADWANGVALGPGSTVLVTGITNSSGWVDSNGDGLAGGVADVAYAGGGDAFVLKTTAAAVLSWSTTLGGANADQGIGITVGAAGEIFVAGATYTPGWATGGFDTTFGGERDAFVARLTPAGATAWSCYLGGTGPDSANGIAVDSSGNLSVCGDTQSANWVTGGFDTALSGTDGFVVRLGDNAPVAPTGTFLATVGAADVQAGRGFWDLSGHYDTDLGASAITADLTHTTAGKFEGTSLFYPDAGNKVLYAIPLVPKGSAKLSKGVVTVKLTLKGKQIGIPGDPAAKASASVTMTLALDPVARTLTGPWKATWALGAAKTSASGDTSLAVPTGMDGTYRLVFDLNGASTSVTGDAALQLSNGGEYGFAVSGTYGGAISTVTLAGEPSNPAARAIKISTSMKTVDDGTAILKTFSGKAFGQSVKW